MMARRPIIEAAVDRFTENRPIASAIVAGIRAAEARTDTNVTPADTPAVTEEIAEAIGRDPVAVNATGLERKRESRVVAGSTGAVLSSLGTFFTGIGGLFGALGPTLALSGPARWVSIAMTLLGGAGGASGLFTLFGRLKADLPPMYFRWWNPLSWLARRREDVLTDPIGA